MCPSGVRYCSPSVARICSRWAGSASSRSSVINPSRWPIVAGSPAPVDRYVNSSEGWTGTSPELGNQSTPSTLSWASARRWATRNGTSSVLFAWSPASTMRQLAQIPFACGRQLQRHDSRIRHVPTTDASTDRHGAVDTYVEHQLRLADDATQRVEEHLVAARRARQSLHISSSLADNRGRMVRMTDRRAVTGGVLVDDDGPVRVVTIDRPERRNAVDSWPRAALLEAFVAFDEDDALSVAVLTGSGGYFCAGADLKALVERRSSPGERRRPRTDGPDQAATVEAGDRRHRGAGRRRRTGAGAVVRPPCRGRRCGARRVLPALRCATRRRRHDQSAAV